LNVHACPSCKRSGGVGGGNLTKEVSELTGNMIRQQPLQMKEWAFETNEAYLEHSLLKNGRFRVEPKHYEKLDLFKIPHEVKSCLTHQFCSSTMQIDGPRTFPAQNQETDVTLRFD
jgi:hypothetical protein